MANDKQILILTIILYAMSTIVYSTFFISHRERFAKMGSWLIRIGLVFHTIALITRTVEASRLPLTNQYEFAISFAWGISLTFVTVEWKQKFKSLGIFAAPMILIISIYAAMQSTEIKPLMPALQSNWLFIHVATAIFSYGAFAIACAISIMFLTRNKFKNDTFVSKYLPRIETLDQISYKSIAFGFIMLTFVIVTGAIWAERAWGKYWSWDPKETWSLITWIIYAIYLHLRLNKGWKNKKTAWFAILGFIAIIFTYIGVNTLLVGYHSYA